MIKCKIINNNTDNATIEITDNMHDGYTAKPKKCNEMYKPIDEPNTEWQPGAVVNAVPADEPVECNIIKCKIINTNATITIKKWNTMHLLNIAYDTAQLPQNHVSKYGMHLTKPITTLNAQCAIAPYVVEQPKKHAAIMIVPIKIPNMNTPCTVVDDAVYNHLNMCMNNTAITIVEPIACKPGAILPMFDMIMWNKIEPTPIIGSDTKHTPVMILNTKMIINVKPMHHKYEMFDGTGYANTWFLMMLNELIKISAIKNDITIVEPIEIVAMSTNVNADNDLLELEKIEPNTAITNDLLELEQFAAQIDNAMPNDVNTNVITIEPAPNIILLQHNTTEQLIAMYVANTYVNINVSVVNIIAIPKKFNALLYNADIIKISAMFSDAMFLNAIAVNDTIKNLKPKPPHVTVLQIANNAAATNVVALMFVIP